MRGLVLSGGSIKGAFQAGAIAEVLRGGWYPDAVYGVSVGALNGAFVTSRVGRSRLSAGEPLSADQVRASWNGIAEELESFWRREITSFKKLGKKRSVFELFLQVARSRFNGLLKMDGLNEIVRREIKPEDLQKSVVKYQALSVNMANGTLVAADNKKPDVQRHILASTRIPIVMPIERIEDQPHLDGGIRDVAPLGRAIDEGADEIVTILCHPKQVETVWIDWGNLLRYANRLMDVVVNEIMSNDVALAHRVNDAVKSGKDTKHKPVTLIDIQPDGTLDIEIEKFTAAQIADLLEEGRRIARREMEKKRETV